MTQSQQVLQWLKPPGRTITPMSAFHKFNITCLAERCRDLRDKGHKIKTKMVTKNKKRFATYSL